MTAPIDLQEGTLKQLLKEALAETLHEQRALLSEVFAEVLEEYVLSASVREGLENGSVSRDEVFRTLRGHS